MSKREINLIGGFYKDSALPWSAQDTVNWLPVVSNDGGTRSPMKLRGVPGLRALGENVLPLFSDLALVTNAAFYKNTPIDFASQGSALLSPPPLSEPRGAISRNGLALWADSAPGELRAIQYSGQSSAPWTSAGVPISGSVSCECVDVSDDGKIACVGTSTGARVFRWNGFAWSELSFVGSPITSNVQVAYFSPDGTRLVCCQGGTASPLKVYAIGANTFTLQANDNTPNLVFQSTQRNCYAYSPRSNSVAVVAGQGTSGSNADIFVVQLAGPNVVYSQQVPRPSGATSSALICRFIDESTLLVGFGGGDALHLYSFNGSALTYSGLSPWQPPAGETLRRFALSRDGKYLAYHPGGAANSNGIIFVRTDTWTEVAAPSSNVVGSISWLNWCN